MPIPRTGVLVGLIVCLIAVTLQNQTPPLSLVFLGMRSQPFPLGIWMVGAVMVGALLGVILLFILNLGNSEPRRTMPRRPPPRRSTAYRKPTTDSAWDTPTSNDWGASASDWGPKPSPKISTPRTESEDDIDTPGSIDEQRYKRAGRTPPPKSPTAYSRSIRDPEFARQSGQQDSVFEAEYRMVNPPSQNGDWDDIDDDFFEGD